MQKVPLASAKPETVFPAEMSRSERPDALPICGKAVALSERLIDGFKRLGIRAVFLEGNRVKIDGYKTFVEEMKLREKRFKLVKCSPPMKRIKEIYGT